MQEVPLEDKQDCTVTTCPDSPLFQSLNTLFSLNSQTCNMFMASRADNS